MFGAIHCIPWSFHFATLREQWVWRISAILLSSMPISVMAFGILLPEKRNKPIWMKLCKAFLMLIIMAMLFLYIMARITLLILPFAALRALLPGAYAQINWISFLPHI
jgi:hypothetical protein